MDIERIMKGAYDPTAEISQNLAEIFAYVVVLEQSKREQPRTWHALEMNEVRGKIMMSLHRPLKARICIFFIYCRTIFHTDYNHICALVLLSIIHLYTPMLMDNISLSFFIYPPRVNLDIAIFKSISSSS